VIDETGFVKKGTKSVYNTYSHLIVIWRSIVSAGSARFKVVEWIKRASPFVLLSSAVALHKKIDIIVIGWLGTGSDPGIYSACIKASVTLMFTLTSIPAVVNPKLSSLCERNEKSFKA